MKINELRLFGADSILVFILLVSSSNLFAQTGKGNFVLSGGTGLQFTSSHIKYEYDGQSQGTSNISSFSLVPTFGYFVTDNLAIGLTSTINTSTNKYENGDKDVSTITLVLPTALYYFTMAGKIRPIAQVGIGYHLNPANLFQNQVVMTKHPVAV